MGNLITVKTKKKNLKIIQESARIKNRLLECVDLDAKAYLKVVASRQGSFKQKQTAQRESRKVPLEVCQLCYRAIVWTPFLVECGNKHLITDVEAAVELLLASFKSALIFTKG